MENRRNISALGTHVENSKEKQDEDKIEVMVEDTEDSEKKLFRNPASFVGMLGEAKSNSISLTSEVEWQEIEFTVDSGACDTVMPGEECPHIDVVSSEKSRKGFSYEVANGNEIANQGERRCIAMTENSRTPKRIDIQVAVVHKCLLSVAKCTDMGYDCVLGKEGGSLWDRITGEQIPIRRKGNLYVLRMWVKQVKENESQGFQRRG